MASEMIIIGAGVGAVALLAGSSPPAPRPTNLAPSGGVVLPGQSEPASSVQARQRRVAVIGRFRSQPAGGSTRSYEPAVASQAGSSNTASGSGMNSSDPNIRGKLDNIEVAAKSAYDNLSSDAKAQGAAALNSSLNLSPPLTGNESWDTVGSVVGGSLGAAAGSYLGGPIGAKLGAICGAYLGVQLADLLSKNWDELNGWLKSTWTDVSNYISQQAQGYVDQGEQAAQDAYNYVGGLF